MSNVIPEGWKAYNLGDLASKIEGGGTPSRTVAEYWNGSLPWVTVKDLKGVRLQTTLESITHAGLKQSASKLIPANTMILASRMAVGKAVVFDKDVTINQDLKAFYPKDILETEYLLQWYLSKSEIIESMGTGSTVKGIKLDDIKVLPIDLPPLPEQKKIAAILTSVDDVIEKTQAQIDKLKDLKTGMMQELLTRGVGVDGKPHTEFKDSPVGRVPKGWEVVELDQTAKVIDCKHATPKYFSNGFPVVKPGNIKEGFLNISGCALTDRAGFDNLNENHTPVVGDIIYSRNQTYGVGAYVNRPMEFCIGQDVCVIHPLKCDSLFLYYMINSPVVKEQVELLAAGSTFKRINLGSIRKLKVVLPNIEEQKAIGSVFESVDCKISLLEKKLVKKRDTKKALMQDLLTGKVRVKVVS